jgi:ubiquinone/menaquinone biosynthesis C-methylase UbiE
MSVLRLNFGSGYQFPEDWTNLDKLPYGQEYISDILSGLTFADGYFSYIVAHHVLQMFMYQDLKTVFDELYRVTAPRGVIRISVPDIIKAFHAYEAGNAKALLIPDSVETSLDAKFSAYLTWYGTNPTAFTFPYLRELLLRAGWTKVFRAEAGKTASAYEQITELDQRPDESLYVEAFK